MKIHIILEGHPGRLIRGVTLSAQTALKICKAFSHLDLFFETYETIEDETLRSFLNGDVNARISDAARER